VKVFSAFLVRDASDDTAEKHGKSHDWQHRSIHCSHFYHEVFDADRLISPIFIDS
jgi:hypothetical protein